MKRKNGGVQGDLSRLGGKRERKGRIHGMGTKKT
jgi:hypothetical protein